MSRNRILSIIMAVVIHTPLFGQFFIKNEELTKNEITILTLISKDTLHSLNFKFSTELFDFGIEHQKPNLDYFTVLKNKKEIYIQVTGTGKVYQVLGDAKKGFSLERQDSTYFNGSNFHSITLLNKDTLFQFGGDGHWNLRGIVTYFSHKTNEWELYNCNRLLNLYENATQPLIYKFDTSQQILYISNSLKFGDFPREIAYEVVDSCFSFNIKDRRWTTLGKLSQGFEQLLTQTKKIYEFGDKIIVQYQLEFYWVDFKNNQWGKIKVEDNIDLKQLWLREYKKEPEIKDFQFLLGNQIYFFRTEEDGLLTYKSKILNPTIFDFANKKEIYIPVNPFFSFIINNQFKIILFILPILGLLLIFIIFRARKNKNVPKALEQILSNHFISSLTVVEKELVRVLYNHHLKNETISTPLINKLIGVQKKDIMTQNKTRSDHFLKINQKFKLATLKELPLIIKSRELIDKRQFSYGLHPDYVIELGGLLKD